MCQGQGKRSAYGKTDSYKKKEQERLGNAPRYSDQIPSDAPKGTDMAAGLLDAIRPPEKNTVDPTKPRTIKDGTTVSGRQIDTSTRQRSRRLRPTRMGRRTGTNSLRIPLNSNRGTGNLNY